MTEILDLPEVRARVTRLKVETYEALVEMGALGKREELIRGVIVQKMSKSPLHYTLNERLCDHFRQQLPAGYVVRPEGPLRLADSQPEPDIAIVIGSLDDFLEKHPATAELVVEVAVSSAALDRENASLYAEASVREYWIVLGLEQKIEVYRQLRNGAYQERHIYTVGETLVCQSVPGLRTPLSDLFA